ncbi:MAG: glycosyltransferase [Dethiobacteria bacterium]|jgi:glycosyltransferase involved in cell wall biosynthesis|nr:glycosyltransferase family 4 protein [Bacillota bacterium]
MRLILFNRFQYGGETGHILSLARFIKEAGFQPFLVFAGYPNSFAQKYRNYLQGLNRFFIKTNEEFALLIHSLRPSLLHTHSPADFHFSALLASNYRLRWLATVHEGVVVNEKIIRELQTAQFIICTGPTAFAVLKTLGERVVLLPEGIDLKRCFPGEKGELLTITFAGKVEQKNAHAFNALCKAIDLLERRCFRVIANVKPSSFNAHYAGWLPSACHLLAEGDIVVGSGRFVLEGLACGNAALVLGQKNSGLLGPENFTFPLDLSGLSGKEPCYREIFFALGDLYTDRHKLRRLQSQGRRYACENHDQRLIGEKTAELYRRALDSRPAAAHDLS